MKYRMICTKQNQNTTKLGFSPRPIEKHIPTWLARYNQPDRKVSDIHVQLETDLLTRQDMKMGRWTKIPSQASQERPSSVKSSSVSLFGARFPRHSRKNIRRIGKPENGQKAKFFKHTIQASYKMPPSPKSSSVSLYDAPFPIYRRNSIYRQQTLAD